jgi:hypothetical protein
MAAITVTTSATLIATGDGSGSFPSEVLVTNDSGGTVYLGKDDTVTTSTGLTLANLASLGLKLLAGREVWGIVASGTEEVRAEVWS